MPNEELTATVIAAIEAAPCSPRALAREAGVPHSTLSRIKSGERGATVAVAIAVADALERWAQRTHAESQRIRQHLPGGHNE